MKLTLYALPLSLIFCSPAFAQVDRDTLKDTALQRMNAAVHILKISLDNADGRKYAKICTDEALLAGASEMDRASCANGIGSEVKKHLSRRYYCEGKATIIAADPSRTPWRTATAVELWEARVDLEQCEAWANSVTATTRVGKN